MNQTEAMNGWGELVRENAGWLVALGIAQVFLGMLAIAAPLVTGVAVSWMVGALLLMAGLSFVVQAFKAGSWGLGILGFLLGVLTVLGGLALLARPLYGVAVMTLVLGAYFLVSGINMTACGFRLKGCPGSGWTVFAGIVTILLALLIWSDWPLSGRWAVGTLVGIHILFTGWSMIAIGGAARQASKPPETGAA